MMRLAANVKSGDRFFAIHSRNATMNLRDLVVRLAGCQRVSELSPVTKLVDRTMRETFFTILGHLLKCTTFTPGVGEHGREGRQGRSLADTLRESEDHPGSGARRSQGSRPVRGPSHTESVRTSALTEALRAHGPASLLGVGPLRPCVDSGHCLSFPGADGPPRSIGCKEYPSTCVTLKRLLAQR